MKSILSRGSGTKILGLVILLAIALTAHTRVIRRRLHDEEGGEEEEEHHSGSYHSQSGSQEDLGEEEAYEGTPAHDEWGIPDIFLIHKLLQFFSNKISLQPNSELFQTDVILFE